MQIILCWLVLRDKPKLFARYLRKKHKQCFKQLFRCTLGKKKTFFSYLLKTWNKNYLKICKNSKLKLGNDLLAITNVEIHFLKVKNTFRKNISFNMYLRSRWIIIVFLIVGKYEWWYSFRNENNIWTYFYFRFN